MTSNIVQEVQNKYSFLDNLFRSLWKSFIKSNLSLKVQLQNIKWKNPKAKPGCAYQPTEVSRALAIIEAKAKIKSYFLTFSD